MRLLIGFSENQICERRLFNQQNEPVGTRLKEFIYVSNPDGLVQTGEEDLSKVLQKE